MNYKYLQISAKPQPINQIVDPKSETNKAIDKEMRLVLHAPELKQALQDIYELASKERHNIATNLILQRAAQALKLIEIKEV